MRDIVLTLIILGSLPFCFTRPWIGILVWSWLSYMNPHQLCWGFATTIPFAAIVAITTTAGWLCTDDRYKLPWTREEVLLIALWAVFALSTLCAFNPSEAWIELDRVSKILFMTFMTLLLMQDRSRLHLLLLVIALSIGFFGLKGGLFVLLTGGAHRIFGPPGSFIAGNNEIGLAFNMILPLLMFLRREESRRWLRRLLLTMFYCTVLATLATYSRGAFLGLAIVLPTMALKRKGWVLSFLLSLSLIPVALFVLPDKWFERMETISTYNEDRSATARLEAWGVAYRIALDHPFLGGGFRTFREEMYQQYLPGSIRLNRDAHSIFFQVLGEHGFTGAALYVGLILSTMLSLRQLVRRSRHDPSTAWIGNYAQMLESSLLGYVVSGTFLTMAYFDLFYHFVVATVILKKLASDYEQRAVWPSQSLPNEVAAWASEKMPVTNL